MGTILQRIFSTAIRTDRGRQDERKGGLTNGGNYIARRPKCFVSLGIGDL